MAPDTMSLEGRRILVTGASSGLGAAMAEALHEAGATVALAARPGPRLDEVVARLSSRGPRDDSGAGSVHSHDVLGVPVDVREPQGVDRAISRAVTDLGGIDMVVNNAGIGMRTVNPRFFEHAQPFFEVDPGAFSDVIATNLTGYFLVARALALHFVEQGAGSFVNVSINRETMVRAGFVPYGPSRAGSEALSMVMTEDLRPHGIAVNLLLPGGATDTGMIPETLPASARARLLDPAIMGPPVVFLASEEAEGITGVRIVASEFEQWLADFRVRRAVDDSAGGR